MITIAQWLAQIQKARAELPVQIEAAVRVNAELAAEIARREIGHLQPDKAFGTPVPFISPAWDPLAMATVQDKTQLGFSPPDYSPLERTGQAEQSIKAVAFGNTGGVVSDDKVMFYHEVGTSTMPPRPVFAPALAETLPAFERTLSMLAVNALIPRP